MCTELFVKLPRTDTKMLLTRILSATLLLAAAAVSAVEYGYLEIRFENGNGAKDIDNANCDNCFLCYNPCDPYMVVKIDGVQKYRTPTSWDTNTPKFDATFTSGRISKDSNVAIEMWDNDAGDSDDDLMARWNSLSIDMLTLRRSLADRENYVEIHSQWEKA